MNLQELSNRPGDKRAKKRVGCGESSGHGKTSCRGTKGQMSRSGHKRQPTFEGGQMRLIRRIPKRGFHNAFGKTVAAGNVGDLNEVYASGEEVTLDSLRVKDLAKGRYDELKILGDGELTKKLKINAHRFSASALEKIQKAGGEAVVLPGKKPVVKGKGKKVGKTA